MCFVHLIASDDFCCEDDAKDYTGRWFPGHHHNHPKYDNLTPVPAAGLKGNRIAHRSSLPICWQEVPGNIECMCQTDRASCCHDQTIRPSGQITAWSFHDGSKLGDSCSRKCPDGI